MVELIKTYIGIGSNIEDPILQVTEAIKQLSCLPKASLMAQSSLYRSKPVGFSEQPDFINAVVCLATSNSPQALLLQLQMIEDKQGRVRERRFGPRTLDLDLLLYGDQIVNTNMLTIPHYAMFERDFVLIPLYEIAPDLQLPGGAYLKEIIAE